VAKLLIDTGVRQISLADTVGLAAPALIGETVARVLATGNAVEIGVHLHARPADAAAKMTPRAYQVGCRRFDAAIAGWWMPLCAECAVGELPTEILIDRLKSLEPFCRPSLLEPLDQVQRGICAHDSDPGRSDARPWSRWDAHEIQENFMEDATI